MFVLETSLSKFRDAVVADQPVAFGHSFNWYVEGVAETTIRWLFAREVYRQEHVIDTFSLFMDQLERGDDRALELRAYTAAVVLMEKYQNADNCWKIVQRVEAVAIRFGIICPQENKTLDNRIYQLAESWKSKQTYLSTSVLSRAERACLEVIASFPSYQQLLLESPEVSHPFFNWTLRDKNRVQSFVELPATVAHIQRCDYLSSRLGRYDLLRYDREHHSLNVLCEGAGWYDLRQLDQVISCKTGLSVTVREFLDDFQMRARRIGHIEATPHGMVSYSSRSMGPYRSLDGQSEFINLNQLNWWRDLFHYATLSRQELLELIPKKWDHELLELGEGDWVFSLVVTSQNNQKVLMAGNHGYLMVAEPISGDRYNLYSFGKFTDGDWPETVTENLKVAFSYLSGVILSPDENIFYTDRDSEYIATPVSGAGALILMERVRDSIRAGWEGRLPFQLFGANCMGWCVDMLSPHIPKSYFLEQGWASPFEVPSDGMGGALVKCYKYGLKYLVRSVLDWLADNHGGAVKMLDNGRYVCFNEHKPWADELPRFANPSIMLLRRRQATASLQ